MEPGNPLTDLAETDPEGLASVLAAKPSVLAAVAGSDPTVLANMLAEFRSKNKG
ncbi:MAG: hypothetical protein ACREX8_13940 [Gammaproteobacteria bacterium]